MKGGESYECKSMICIFFFQAEDGIRDSPVTGVQTCALPISLAYRKYSMDYVPNEDAAKAAGKGLWRGAFVAPWDWRRGKRHAIETINEHRRCSVKGNIGKHGARIYHIPGSANYSRTRISETKGERWFCSEEEARAAGWRRPMR